MKNKELKMIKRNSILTASIVACSILFTGCVSTGVKQTDFLETNIYEPRSFNDELIKQIRESQEAISGQNSTFYKRNIDLKEDNEIILPEAIASMPVIIEEYDTGIKNIIRNLSIQTGLNLVSSVGEREGQVYSINIRNKSLSEAIYALEEMLDIDIIAKENTLYVYDSMSISGVFENLAVLDTKISENIYARIRSQIGRVLNEENAIIIDDATGSFIIKSTPNKIRNTRLLIENIINESSAHAILKLNVYQINNRKAQELGISADGLVGKIYNLGMGSTANVANPIVSLDFDKKWGLFEATNGDLLPTERLNFGLKAMERASLLHSVSSPIFTIFNGVTTKLENTKQIGEWIPGQLTEETTTNADGVRTTSYRESEPRFDTDDVGRIVTVNSKINMVSKHAQIVIDYEETEAYAKESTTWYRREDSPIELKKNLITKHAMKGQVVIKDGGFSIISGTKSQQTNFSTTSLPGTSGSAVGSVVGSNSKSGEMSDVLIVAQVIFPKQIHATTITKQLPSFIGNSLQLAQTKESVNYDKSLLDYYNEAKKGTVE
jgi:hypothetical protein